MAPLAVGPHCAYGPDVWEIIKFLHDVDERGPTALTAAAEVFAVDVNLITTAARYYSDYSSDVDAEINAAEDASVRADNAWHVQQRLIA